MFIGDIMKEKIKKIYNFCTNKEVILYLVFGVLTTVISICTFYIFTTHIFSGINEDLNISLSNIISFILAVSFAFITNKTVVFNSKTDSKKDFLKEIVSFFMARIFTLLIDTFGILLFVKVLCIHKMIAKIFFNIVIIILNYILSKLIIFKNKKVV